MDFKNFNTKKYDTTYTEQYYIINNKSKNFKFSMNSCYSINQMTLSNDGTNYQIINNTFDNMTALHVINNNNGIIFTNNICNLVTTVYLYNNVSCESNIFNNLIINFANNVFNTNYQAIFNSNTLTCDPNIGKKQITFTFIDKVENNSFEYYNAMSIIANTFSNNTFSKTCAIRFLNNVNDLNETNKYYTNIRIVNKNLLTEMQMSSIQGMLYINEFCDNTYIHSLPYQHNNTHNRFTLGVNHFIPGHQTFSSYRLKMTGNYIFSNTIRIVCLASEFNIPINEISTDVIHESDNNNLWYKVFTNYRPIIENNTINALFTISLPASFNNYTCSYYTLNGNVEDSYIETFGNYFTRNLANYISTFNSWMSSTLTTINDVRTTTLITTDYIGQIVCNRS